MMATTLARAGDVPNPVDEGTGPLAESPLELAEDIEEYLYSV